MDRELRNEIIADILVLSLAVAVFWFCYSVVGIL